MRKLVLLGLVQALLLLAGCGGGSGSVVTTSNNGSGGGWRRLLARNTITMTVERPDPNGNDVDTPVHHGHRLRPGKHHQLPDDRPRRGRHRLLWLARHLLGARPRPLPPRCGRRPTSNGNSVVECTKFADGFTWGPVKAADVQIAGESANNVPIQVIGDPAYLLTSTPSGTTNEIPPRARARGPEEDTVAAFGANAIIGIGRVRRGLRSAIAACPRATPESRLLLRVPGEHLVAHRSLHGDRRCPTPAQVTDPVTLLPDGQQRGDHRAARSAEGASYAPPATLIFGIGTESNNSVNATDRAHRGLPRTATSARRYTTRGGQAAVPALLLFRHGIERLLLLRRLDPIGPGLQQLSRLQLAAAGLVVLPQPPSSAICSATNTGQNGMQSTVTFSIGNAYTLFNASAVGNRLQRHRRQQRLAIDRLHHASHGQQRHRRARSISDSLSSSAGRSTSPSRAPTPPGAAGPYYAILRSA